MKRSAIQWETSGLREELYGDAIAKFGAGPLCNKVGRPPDYKHWVENEWVPSHFPDRKEEWKRIADSAKGQLGYLRTTSEKTLAMAGIQRAIALFDKLAGHPPKTEAKAKKSTLPPENLVYKGIVHVMDSIRQLSSKEAELVLITCLRHLAIDDEEAEDEDDK